jgi:hypothetical protein
MCRTKGSTCMPPRTTRPRKGNTQREHAKGGQQSTGFLNSFLMLRLNSLTRTGMVPCGCGWVLCKKETASIGAYRQRVHTQSGVRCWIVHMLSQTSQQGCDPTRHLPPSTTSTRYIHSKSVVLERAIQTQEERWLTYKQVCQADRSPTFVRAW